MISFKLETDINLLEYKIKESFYKYDVDMVIPIFYLLLDHWEPITK